MAAPQSHSAPKVVRRHHRPLSVQLRVAAAAAATTTSDVINE